jgi:hypothetical protein
LVLFATPHHNGAFGRVGTMAHPPILPSLTKVWFLASSGCRKGQQKGPKAEAFRLRWTQQMLGFYLLFSE